MRIIILILIFALISCKKEQLNEVNEMAKQTIDIGTSYDDTADPARDGFDKCNGNFTELYDLNDTREAEILAIEQQIGDNVKRDIAIGTWDMDTDDTKSVTWTLPANMSIRSIYVGIFGDSGTSGHYPLTIGDPTTGAAQGSVYYNGTSFILQRLEAGIFDGVSYNGASNRGWITVEYNVINPS